MSRTRDLGLAKRLVAYGIRLFSRPGELGEGTNAHEHLGMESPAEPVGPSRGGIHEHWSGKFGTGADNHR